MENLNYDSTSEQLPNSSALQAQSVVINSQNHPSESRDDRSGYDVVIPIKDGEEEDQHPPQFLTLTTLSLSRRSGYDVIPIKDDKEEDQRPPPFITVTTQSQRVPAPEGILDCLCTGIIVLMNPILASLVPLKFQSKSPSETHRVLFNTFVVAYVIAVPAFILICYLRTRPMKKILDTILQSIVHYFCILSLLSIVLLLLIPEGYDRIGYLNIVVLLLVIIGCNFGGYIKNYLVRKKVSSLGAVQRDESSPQTTLTISG